TALAHQRRRARQQLRAVQADALVTRLTEQHTRRTFEAQAGHLVERLVADARVVDAAAAVIDRAWTRSTTEGSDDDD
ncbi:MAG: hypothetical protein JWO98_1226, partial [Frankiales bacterium]|nr:hypothetical protein [Frankiales bacterium]